MKTVSQVLFGLVLGAAGIVVGLYRGLLLNGQPDWRTGAAVLLLMATTQWISFCAFRRHIALQVIFGVILCMATAVSLFRSSHSFFWETRYPDGSNPITSRSDIALLLLIAITQGISFLTFRRIRHSKRGKTSKA
ncbi:MAG: hypothetical protein ABSH00_07180 [Bryobacteraceae bacterium]|jgi:hypothetical protein